LPISDGRVVAPGVFRSANVPPAVFGDLVFRTDGQEPVIELLQENNPTTAYIKAPWYATPTVNLTLLGICLVLFLSVLIWAPIGLWIARRIHTSPPAPARLSAWVAGLLSVLSLGFLIGFSVLFSNPETILGLPAWAQILFLAPWVIAALAIAMMVCTVAAWVRGYWSLPGRIHYTLVALAALTFVAWLAYWNLWRIAT
jgi:hypothetical protein